jgi:hypothetical protein
MDQRRHLNREREFALQPGDLPSDNRATDSGDPSFSQLD